jgi:quercetin dioxygenase-like cupin family protein
LFADRIRRDTYDGPAVKPQEPIMKIAGRTTLGFLFAVILGFLNAHAVAQDHAGPKLLAEKRVAKLPTGPLFWRIDNFRTVAEAQAAAGPTGLVAEAAGKVWLFSLGASGNAPSGATRVAEVGPLPTMTGTPSHLQVREANNAPGTRSPVHTHPGSEAFYVLSGEMMLKSSHGAKRVTGGQSLLGPQPGSVMQVSNDGPTNLHMFVMFVLEADKPFSSPGTFD